MARQRSVIRESPEEVVELAELRVQEILVPVAIGHRDRRLRMRIRRLRVRPSCPGKQHRLDTRRAAQGLVEVTGVHLDAADEQVGVVVAHEEDSRSAHLPGVVGSACGASRRRS